MNPEQPVEGGSATAEKPASSPTGLESTQIVQCWNTVGVLGGNRTCPELEEYMHCRNCLVYAEAGVKLLDRALPPGYRKEWTQRLAERKTDAVTGKNSFLIFRLGEAWLALPTRVFQEVTERRVIRSLPHQRNKAVLGMVIVRGELLLCLSLERLCGLTGPAVNSGGSDPQNRLLVTVWNGFRQAFPVDEVFGLHRFHPQEIKESPAFVAATASACTRGVLDWNGRMVSLLNEELLYMNINQNLA